MTPKHTQLSILALLLFSTFFVAAQNETSQWKFQIAFGVNSPSDPDKADQYEIQGLNFPSVNLGIQHMFSRNLGAKLDYGFNRAISSDESQEYKFNYSRINLQLVYDFKNTLGFIPPRMALVGHVGPGLSFTKPLSPFTENTYTYLNALGGLEVHFGVAQTVSVFGDISYAMGFSGDNKYDPATDGFSFNGDMLFISVGVSVSLSGCYFCD